MLEIDFGTIVFTVINLLLLFIGMRIFLFKPVNKILEQRQAEADEVMKNAGERRDEADALKKQYEEALAKTEQERTEILEDARQRANEDYNKMLDEARSEAENIKENAAEEGERRKERIISEAGKEIADLIAVATEKAMGNADNSELYDEFLNKMGEKK